LFNRAGCSSRLLPARTVFLMFILAAVFVAGNTAVAQEQGDGPGATTASITGVLGELVTAVNAGDREAFIGLFSEDYDYNGEKREGLVKYFFSMEGPAQGRSQQVSIMSSRTSQEGDAAVFDYTRCSTTPGRVGGYDTARVCGGGTAEIRLDAGGRISMFRPVTTYMKASQQAEMPFIDEIRINGREVDTRSFAAPVPVEAGSLVNVGCRIEGDIESVSLALGHGLASGSMEPVEGEGEEGRFLGGIEIPAGPADYGQDEYFIYIKPYIRTSNKRTEESVFVATVPVQIEKPASPAGKMKRETAPQLLIRPETMDFSSGTGEDAGGGSR